MVRELASHQCGPGSNPVVSVMWLEFVVGSPPWSDRFSHLLNSQHFQIQIRSGTNGHVYTSSYELLGDSSVNKLQFATNCKHNFTLVVPTGLDESCTVAWPFFIAVTITNSAALCSARICLRIRLLLWEKGEYSKGKAPWYQCTHARTHELCTCKEKC